MEIHHTRALMRTAAERWKRQYHDPMNGWYTQRFDAKVIHDKLIALNPDTATVADFEAIIGNPGWVQNLCHVCSEYRPVTIELAGMMFCLGCLSELGKIAEALKRADL